MPILNFPSGRRGVTGLGFRIAKRVSLVATPPSHFTTHFARQMPCVRAARATPAGTSMRAPGPSVPFTGVETSSPK